MRPRLAVLGTAQDGGVPHPGCGCATCAAARAEPAHARRVASVALLGASGRALLVDATPDLPAQLDRLAAVRGRAPAPPDAILLTHVHVGHVLGLAFLGREALDAQEVPVLATDAVAAWVRANRPWSHLVERGQIVLRRLVPGERFEFDGLGIEPFPSPHRAEDADTVGIGVRGPRRTALYLPDADRFDDALTSRIEAADLALVDGTFHDAAEVGHRDVALVPHPFVAESVARLAGARGRVSFTHLNHTNPLLHPDPARRPALPSPFTVLEEGAVFDL